MTAPTQAQARPAAAPIRAARLVPVAAALALSAAIMGMLVGGEQWSAPPAGIPDAGPVVAWGLTILTTVTTGLGILTLGWTGAAVWFVAPGRNDSLVPAARADLRIAWRLSIAWAITAALCWWLTVAQVAAVPLRNALQPSMLADYGLRITTANAFLLSSAVAIGAAIVCSRATDRDVIRAAAVLIVTGLAIPAFGGHAASSHHTLAVPSAVLHAASAGIWMGGLVAFYVYIGRDRARLRARTLLFGRVALSCVIVIAATGTINALVHLDGLDQLFSSRYGALVLTKTVLLIALVAVAAPIRLRLTARLGSPATVRPLAALVTAELLLVATALGLGIALAETSAVG